MISVIIPTYNNKTQFLTYLKQNFQFIKDCEIIIVNDNPKQDLSQIPKEFPSIRLINNQENLGFAKSVNYGIGQSHGEFILLLNDDVKLLDESYQTALKYFKRDDKLFAVSFAQKEKGERVVGKNVLDWQRGLFFHRAADNLEPGLNAWAEGGSCLIDKVKFHQLNGFNTIYSHFYWEDIDLSYRAEKKGWRIFFDPTIIVIHHHQSTIGKNFDKETIKRISFHNQFLFVWKNISNVGMWIQHIVFLPYNLIYYKMKGENQFIKGFFEALKIVLHQ